MIHHVFVGFLVITILLVYVPFTVSPEGPFFNILNRFPPIVGFFVYCGKSINFWRKQNT